MQKNRTVTEAGG